MENNLKFSHNNIIQEYSTIDNSINFYHYIENGINKLIAFSARGKKPMFHFRFKSLEQLQVYLSEQLTYWNKSIGDKLEYRKKHKENAINEFKSVSVGDVFYSSWGYEQTNIDFYQVVDKQGSFLFLREIGGKRVETCGLDSYMVVAVKDNFKGDAFKKKINGHGNIKVNSYSNAYKYDGSPLNETKYY